MNKITVKGLPFKLTGEVILVGQKLEFTAVDMEGQDFDTSDIKGIKVISIFPALNTKVCDLQTARIGGWANSHKEVEFISVTMDDTDVIKEWCIAHEFSNITILSDKKYKHFAELTNLYIPKLHKLARGFIILDNENKIIDLSFRHELSEEPDYALVEKYLSK